MTASSKAGSGNQADADYSQYLAQINDSFLHRAGTGPLFTTDATGLYDAFLAGLPEADRTVYNCQTCRTFVERYGGLVTIDTDGHMASAMWDVQEDTPAFYAASMRAMTARVHKATVTGVFLSSLEILGQPATGAWTHLSAHCPSGCAHRGVTRTAGQAMAEKREDYKNVTAGLAEFSLAAIEQALALLETDALYRSEHVAGPVKWLRDLHTARTAAKNRDYVTWRAIATAPAGFCHPKSSMAGTLLEDIEAGLSFAEVSRRFAAKMHPLQYLRPQAAPKAGNIAQAEMIVAQLDAAGSLSRRYCGPADVVSLWIPKREEPVLGGGIFSHLKAKGSAGANDSRMDDVPPVTITWDKFQRTVLPTAEKIEYYATGSLTNYCVLVTAADPASPPILQWDRETERNPVSWYVYTGGSRPDKYGLSTGYITVYAVALKPNLWGSAPVRHHGEGVLFMLAGAREKTHSGNAIFPEMLRTEFHGIRSVVEAYSRSAKLQDIDGPHAVGMLLTSGHKAQIDLRVTSPGRTVKYRIDRWD